MTASVVGLIIDECTIVCGACNGTGNPTRSPDGAHWMTLGGRCPRCSGKGRLLNDEGRKLGALLGISEHNMNPAPG